MERMPQTAIHPTITSQPLAQNSAKKKQGPNKAKKDANNSANNDGSKPQQDSNRPISSLTVNVNAPPLTKTATPTTQTTPTTPTLSDASLERSLELDSAVRLVTTARLEILSIHDHRSRVLSSSSIGGLGQSDVATTAAAVAKSPTKVKQHKWLLCTLVLSQTNLHILQQSNISKPKLRKASTPKSQQASSSSSPRFSSMSPRRMFSSNGIKSSPSSSSKQNTMQENMPCIRVCTDFDEANASMQKNAHPSMEEMVYDTVPLTRLHDMPKVMCFSPRKGMHTIILRVRPNELESLSDDDKSTMIRLCFSSESEGVMFQNAVTQATQRLRDVTMLTKPGHRAPWISKQVRLVAAHGISGDPSKPNTVLSDDCCSSNNIVAGDSIQLRHSACRRVRVLLSTVHGVHSTTLQLRPQESELVLKSNVMRDDREPSVVYKAKFKVSKVSDGSEVVTVLAAKSDEGSSLPLQVVLVIGAMILFASVCAVMLVTIPEALLSSIGIFDDVTYLLLQRKQLGQVTSDELRMQLLMAVGIWGATLVTWKILPICAVTLGILPTKQTDEPALPRCAWKIDLMNTNAHFEPAIAVVEKQEEENEKSQLGEQQKPEMSWGQGDGHLIGASMQDTPDVWISAAQGNIASAHERWQASLMWRRQLNVDDITKSKPWSFDIVKQEYEHAFIGLDMQGNLISTDTFTGIKAGVRAMAAKGVTQQDYAMQMVYLNEYYLTQRVGETGSLLKIMDLKGVRVSDLSKDVLAYLGEANRTLQNYPELVTSIVLINAPSYFSLIWRVISPMLNKCTARKIKVFSKEQKSREHLLKIIDPQVLPVKYGGTLNVDPRECTLEREFLGFVNSRDNSSENSREQKTSSSSSSTSSGGDDGKPSEEQL